MGRVEEFQAELRRLYAEATVAARAADLAMHRYNLRLAEMHAELEVPPGRHLDPERGIVPDVTT